MCVADRTQVPAHREGAAETAPTAPHATPSADPKRRRTGPERFWRGRGVKIALGFAFAASIAAHYAIAPWTIFPEHSDELHDFDGELTFPVDLFDEPAEDKPEQPQSTTPEQTTDDQGQGPKTKKHADAGAEEEKDGGADLDADIVDAGPEPSDAEVAVVGDGGDTGSNGPRDPTAFLGAGASISAGPALVQLIVNFQVIRGTPVGSQMGPLMSAIPQWDDFIAGSGIDAVRDTDWIYIEGPSLMHTDRDAIFIHYSATDKAVDKAIDVVSHKYDRGGAFDAGVPGIKASLGHADRAERVFLRGQSHLLVVVPPDAAHAAAVTMKGGKVQPKIPANEAVRFIVKTPSHVAPFVLLPTLTELRLWVVPRASDGGADVYAEGDCADEKGAEDQAAKAKKYIAEQNSIGVRMITDGLFNGVELRAEGKTVKGHMSASRSQLQNVLGLAAGSLGVTLQQNGTTAQ